MKQHGRIFLPLRLAMMGLLRLMKPPGHCSCPGSESLTPSLDKAAREDPPATRPHWRNGRMLLPLRPHWTKQHGRILLPTCLAVLGFLRRGLTLRVQSSPPRPAPFAGVLPPSLDEAAWKHLLAHALGDAGLLAAGLDAWGAKQFALLTLLLSSRLLQF
ncbi:hypothetical protein DUNSADRAFT_17053 [Dunaliella salina]|uniref:Encoded protein n=1 Tax=Dunaliella salina TaxID=3046 RepID=A0ABQ7H0H2_DUNSA|nr:hypothetical protein DUNSADRAFT_17053 [Dunaliella salina]|eukprot:KAF5840356.1 hypothetical protein DUNSADRAFT_17053 [Dunaliella salina]